MVLSKNIVLVCMGNNYLAFTAQEQFDPSYREQETTPTPKKNELMRWFRRTQSLPILTDGSEHSRYARPVPLK